MEGRGEGSSAPDLTDDLGFPIRAADLSEPWNFNGGPTVDDIYMRMRTGLDGTPQAFDLRHHMYDGVGGGCGSMEPREAWLAHARAKVVRDRSAMVIQARWRAVFFVSVVAVIWASSSVVSGWFG